MNKITDELLRIVSDFTGTFQGAYNIREDGGCAGRPVSYTHLDVYKRQVKNTIPPIKLQGEIFPKYGR